MFGKDLYDSKPQLPELNKKQQQTTNLGYCYGLIVKRLKGKEK